MLSILFHSFVAFMKYTAIALYMLGWFLFIIYGVVFVQAWRSGAIR